MAAAIIQFLEFMTVLFYIVAIGGCSIAAIWLVLKKMGIVKR